MVGYELISLDANKAIYNYYPENDFSNKGVISLDRRKNTVSVTSCAVDDEYGFYSDHMTSMLRESNNKSDFRESGYIAWY